MDPQARRRRLWPFLVIPAVVLLLLGAAGVGVVLYVRDRVQAYLDAPPVMVEVSAAYPGASTEEVERQIAIPLEVDLAGMPHLRLTRSISTPGLCVLRCEFKPRSDLGAARLEVINRLQMLQALPAGVTPQLATTLPGDEVLMYTLVGPRDALGKDIYTLSELSAAQDATVSRELLRVPGVGEVTSAGPVKRYEIRLDPDRLVRYGVSVQQVHDAIAGANGNLDGLNIRGDGLFGRGLDPLQAREVLEAKDPRDATAYLRAEEARRIRALRQTVVATVNAVPVRLDDLVAGGPALPGQVSGEGVVISQQARSGQVGVHVQRDDDVRVQGAVCVRPGEDAAAVLARVQAKINELNETPGMLPPGVCVETYWQRGDAVIWGYGTFPAGATPEQAAGVVRKARQVLRQQADVAAVVSHLWPADDRGQGSIIGVEFLIRQEGPVRDEELLRDRLTDQLDAVFPGAGWTFGQRRRDAFLDAFVGGEEEIARVFGTDLEGLEQRAAQVRGALESARGVERVRVLHLAGGPRLDVQIDHDRCARLGVRAAEVSAALQLAHGGRLVTRMVEGTNQFDILLRWPPALRRDGEAIRMLPVEAAPRGQQGEPGAVLQPRVRLADCAELRLTAGTAAIYRENGERFVAVKYRVRGRDPHLAMVEGRDKTAIVLQGPYRVEWGRQ